MNRCDTFRAALTAALSGGRATQARDPERSSLAWSEHLLACEACRALLEAEEALEALMASLPEPHLPQALARRVLARLESVRGDALDRLLELDAQGSADGPGGLPERVLTGLADARREAAQLAQVDHLLERVPAPRVPEGLAPAVLAALERERFGAPVHASSRGAWWRGLSLAASLLVAAGAGFWWVRSRDAATHPTVTEPVAIAPAQPAEATTPEPLATPEPLGDLPPEELLVSLDLLEDWEFLTAEDLDLLLASMDPADAYLLEWETQESDG